MLTDHLLKTKKDCKKLAVGLRYIYRKELDKVWFQHDMAYGHFKDFPRRRTSDKVLGDKAFNFAKNTKYEGH